MICNENEYREAVTRFDEERKRIEAQKAELKRMGLSPAEVKRAVDPIESFHLQLQEEIESYQTGQLSASGLRDLTSTYLTRHH